MTRSTGKRHPVRRCTRCGTHYRYSNLMERRAIRAASAKPSEWGDPVEHANFNVHTVACAKKAGEVLVTKAEERW